MLRQIAPNCECWEANNGQKLRHVVFKKHDWGMPGTTPDNSLWNATAYCIGESKVISSCHTPNKTPLARLLLLLIEESSESYLP
jgi:hypothetical protein